MVLVLPNNEENPENTQTPEKRNISVSVSDGTDAVSGASVSLSKNGTVVASSTTGSAGGCTLSNVEDGTYTVTVTKDGFSDYSDTVTTSVDNTSLTIELTALSP